MDFKEYWNKTHTKFSSDTIVYDDWLDKYLPLLKNCQTPILDLGCGLGNNTLYLQKKGFNVIACDYSDVALKNINDKISGVKILNVDIAQDFPFSDNSFDAIIADLSLHYFDENTTFKIMFEIKRILKPDGILLARVNSTDDENYGANRGKKIEDNYYFVDGYNKRFFDMRETEKYFSIIGNVNATKCNMHRYSKPKKVIEIEVKKI